MHSKTPIDIARSHCRGARYQPVYDEVYKTANGNSDARKVFVRSLDYDRTTEASLREAMSKFGDLDECVIIKDRNTGKSRGFGFVIFKEIDGALAAVEAKSKEIDVSEGGDALRLLLSCNLV